MGKKKKNNKGGRPRKSGERYPSGKLKPQANTQAQDVVGSSSISPTSVHRIRELGRAFALDPKLGTELGRLLLLEQVTSLEAAAGFRLADIYRRFERQHGRRRFAKSPSHEFGFKGGPTVDDDDDAEKPFLAIQEKLKPFGSHARDHIETLCVDDQPIGPAALFEVRAILAYLGKDHFKMHAAIIPARPQDQPGLKVGRRTAVAIAARARETLSRQRRDPAEALAGLLRDVLPRDEVLEVLNFARALRARERYRSEKEAEPAE